MFMYYLFCGLLGILGEQFYPGLGWGPFMCMILCYVFVHDYVLYKVSGIKVVLLQVRVIGVSTVVSSESFLLRI